MKPICRRDADERRDRIDWMIEEFRAAKRRRFVRRALKLWRKAEVDQALVRLEAAPADRIH